MPYNNARSPLSSDGLTDTNNDSPHNISSHNKDGIPYTNKDSIHSNTRSALSRNRLLDTYNDSPQYNTRLLHTGKGMVYTNSNNDSPHTIRSTHTSDG